MAVSSIHPLKSFRLPFVLQVTLAVTDSRLHLPCCSFLEPLCRA